MTRFFATVEAENARSVHLLLRLGFRVATEAEARVHEFSPTERLYVLDAVACRMRRANAVCPPNRRG